ncbi:MAG: 16S rRNA (adenine(1518)-N(6)/adenine(1519)-N(6))-dimethyltransferase RsmA [Hydrogenophilus sp.]|nr:16S rRNA (adenine(1518)-N(6)/adenine(1519)-N(6))-dimethyltransferase RsmA [Hydrogenophilus sp.]
MSGRRGPEGKEEGWERPKRWLGQNFLHDRQVAARIVAALAPTPEERVVEVGPGRGALTEGLLATRIPGGVPLTVVELDPALAAFWMQRAAAGAPLRVVRADAARLDWRAMAAEGPLVVVGNLPYQVAATLIAQWTAVAEQVARAVVMVQREVAERLAAAAGGKSYSRLSVMVQRHFRVERLFDVGSGAFRPRPRVVSSVVRLTPLPPPLEPQAPFPLFAAVVRAAFQQRRKMVVNALAPLLSPSAITAAGVRLEARAEELTPADFERLALQWVAQKGA